MNLNIKPRSPSSSSLLSSSFPLTFPLVFPLIFAFLATILLTACSSPQDSSTPPLQNPSVPIGIILPLTGSGSDQGLWAKQAFDQAKEEIQQDTGVSLHLFYEDSKGGNPQEAVTAYRSITQREKIPVVLTWGSGVGMALTPLANEDHVVQMGFATATPKYRTLHDYTYRNFPSATYEGEYDARLISSFGSGIEKKRVAIAYSNNDYGAGEQQSFSAAYKLVGGEITASEALEAGGADFRTQILKIKTSKPEIVFLPAYPKEGALFLRQAAEEELNATFIASSGILGKDIFEVPAAQGLIVSQEYFDPSSTDPLVRRFVEGFKKRYGEDPQVYSARSYDALNLISSQLQKCHGENTGNSGNSGQNNNSGQKSVPSEQALEQALKQTGTIGECLKNALDTMALYHGVLGDRAFDEAGDLKEVKFQLQVLKGKQLERLTS